MHFIFLLSLLLSSPLIFINCANNVLHALIRVRLQDDSFIYLAAKNNTLQFSKTLNQEDDLEYRFFIEKIHFHYIGILSSSGPRYLKIQDLNGTVVGEFARKKIRKSKSPTSFVIKRYSDNRCSLMLRSNSQRKYVGMDKELKLALSTSLGLKFEILKIGVSDFEVLGSNSEVFANPLPFSESGHHRLVPSFVDRVYLGSQLSVREPDTHCLTLFLRRNSLFADFIKETSSLLRYLRSKRRDYQFPARFIPRVIIEGEKGWDMGGIITDVLGDIGKEFFNPKANIMEQFGEGIYFVTGKSVSQDTLYAFGVYLMISTKLKLPLPHVVSKTFFDWASMPIRHNFIYPKSNFSEEISAYKSIMKIKEPFELEDSGLTFSFHPERSIARQLLIFIKVKFCILPLENWAVIKDGFGHVGPDKFSATYLQEVLSPSNNSTLVYFMKSVCRYEKIDPNSNEAVWFWLFVDRHPDLHLKLFRFITGRETWNPHMMNHFFITITRARGKSDNHLPSTHTW